MSKKYSDTEQHFTVPIYSLCTPYVTAKKSKFFPTTHPCISRNKRLLFIRISLTSSSLQLRHVFTDAAKQKRLVEIYICLLWGKPSQNDTYKLTAELGRMWNRTK